jgi:hypothetical protein
MKNIVSILLTCCTIIACNKSTAEVQNEGLTGKWQLTEYFINPGDGGDWHAADNDIIHTIEFREDGSFSCSDSSYRNVIAYQQVDSMRINFLLPTQIPSYTEYYFKLEDNNQTLILSYKGCIEGCSNKYKVVKLTESKPGSY